MKITENYMQWQIEESPALFEDFIESFWMIKNTSGRSQDIIVLPDGKVDIIFSLISDDRLRVILRGIDTQPDQTTLPPNATLFAVSFTLLGIECLVQEKVSGLINQGTLLPEGFWGIGKPDLTDFDTFCKKISALLSTHMSINVDQKKRDLFELIYKSQGEITVDELSKKVSWQSRQINRYFNGHFGISLKAYCNILRFKLSLDHIKKGKLFPELNYADQNHFIREVKRYSGTTPKILFKNENDRFILLSTLDAK